MKVRIGNEGEHPVRVIVDRDTVNDSTLEAGADELFEANGGVLELRELEMGTDPAEPGGETNG
ncbi:hypothetical protein [Paraburkholderia phytofirmans]|uniref:hypothetical protein n=1 Tax=Paraburkholderia phytofirmans TaxID=261302 RepID=UPI0038BBCEA6